MTSATSSRNRAVSSDIVSRQLLDHTLSSYQVYVNPDTSEPTHPRWADLSKMPTATLNQRLKMAIITYWDATLSATLCKGNIGRDRIKKFEMHSNTSSGKSYTCNTTSVHNVQHASEQYVCDVWFATITITITITINLFLVAASLVTFFLGILTKALDAPGYVCTSACDNFI